MTQSPSISGLKPRFGEMTSSPTSSSPNQPPAPSQGTSFAQKQAALHTASQFRNDPSSITLSDARSSAATANNFRERHGEQVATGWKGANALNKKYDVANRVNGIASQNGSASPVREDGPITRKYASFSMGERAESKCFQEAASTPAREKSRDRKQWNAPACADGKQT